MNSHTPGPWIINDRVKTIGYRPTYITDSDNMPICGVRGEYDALLIAAAPELLEALKKVRSLIDDDEINVDFIDKAINKAEGGFK